ncbi:MAG: hypothetical protein WA581_06490 [Candidatus Acidiferrales bacterium]
MNEKKQIAFYYDGELNNEDTIVDPDGSVTVPEKDAIIRMHGENWRVTHAGRTVGGKDEHVVYKIYLARA